MTLIQKYINQANQLSPLEAQVEDKTQDWDFHAELGWTLPDDHWLQIDITGFQSLLGMVTDYKPVKAVVTTWQGEFVCELPVSELELDISPIIEEIAEGEIA